MTADEFLDEAQIQLSPAVRRTRAPSTVYSYGESVGGPDESEDEWTNKGYSATGENLTEGVVAVNEDAYPLGTVFRDEDSGFVFLAADKHGNKEPGVVDFFAEPENYKQLSGVRNLSVLGQIPRGQIPTTREGVRRFLAQYGDLPGKLGMGPPNRMADEPVGVPKATRATGAPPQSRNLAELREEIDKEVFAQMPKEDGEPAEVRPRPELSSTPGAAASDDEDYIEVPGLPGRKEAEAATRSRTPEQRQANRQKLIDAIKTAQTAGYEVPHQIGSADEPEGDRGPTRDMENLVKALKAQQADEEAAGNKAKAAAVAKERAYWENEIATKGMSAEQAGEGLRIPAKEKGKLREHVMSADAFLDQVSTRGQELMGMTTSEADKYKVARWKDIYTGKEVRRGEKATRVNAEGYLSYKVDPESGAIDFDPRRYRLGLQAALASGDIDQETYKSRYVDAAKVERAAYQLEMLKLKAGEYPQGKAFLHGLGKMGFSTITGLIGAALGTPGGLGGSIVGGAAGGAAGYVGWDPFYQWLTHSFLPEWIANESDSVLAAAELHPEFDAAGQLVIGAVTLPVSARNLYAAAKTTYAAKGAGAAAKLVGGAVTLSGGTSVVVDDLIRWGEQAAGVEGAEGPSLESQLTAFGLGALQSGLFVRNQKFDAKSLFEVAKRWRASSVAQAELDALRAGARARGKVGLPPDPLAQAEIKRQEAIIKKNSVSAAEAEALTKAAKVTAYAKASGKQPTGVRVETATGPTGKPAGTVVTLEQLTAAQRNKYLKILADPKATAAERMEAMMRLTGKGEAAPPATTEGPAAPAPTEPPTAPTEPTAPITPKPTGGPEEAAPEPTEEPAPAPTEPIAPAPAEELAPAPGPGEAPAFTPGQKVSHPKQGEGTFVEIDKNGRVVMKVPHGDTERFTVVPAEEVSAAGPSPVQPGEFPKKGYTAIEPAKEPPAPRTYVQNPSSKEVGDVPIEIDVAALERDYRNSPDYIGPGPEGAIKTLTERLPEAAARQRYENISTMLQANEPVEMPLLFLDRRSKRPAFVYGREVFGWLRDQGHKSVTVAVEPGEADEIRARYGVDAPAPEGQLNPGDIVSFKGKNWQVSEVLKTGSYAIVDPTKGFLQNAEYLGASDVQSGRAKLVSRAAPKAPAAAAPAAEPPALPTAAKAPAAAPAPSTRAEVAARAAPAPQKVEIHAYDVATGEFTTMEVEPSRHVLSQLKVQEAIYERLIKCL